MSRPCIYLDSAATTFTHPEVAKAIAESLCDHTLQGNPSSNTHVFGWTAQKMLKAARGNVAKFVGAREKEIIFTSGATESNNLAIQGAVNLFSDHTAPIHIITSCVEHKAVLDTFHAMKGDNVEVSLVSPNENGIVTTGLLKKHIKPNTKFVSLMYINNETGARNPISELGSLCREHDIIFHVDAAQALGKFPIDLSSLAVDMMSFSGHKIYAPKGIGALYISSALLFKMARIQHGGQQERGLRPGTQSVPLILGLSKAVDVARADMDANNTHATKIKALFVNLISEKVNIKLNGDITQDSPYIANIHFPNMDNDILLMGLSDIAFSTGSACNSQQQSNSHVLEAIYPSRVSTGANLRFSFAHYNSEDDIRQAARKVIDLCNKITGL